jgi:hypothetical protein
MKTVNMNSIIDVNALIQKKKIFTYFQNPFGNLEVFMVEKGDSEWVLENGDIYIINFILRMLP